MHIRTYLTFYLFPFSLLTLSSTYLNVPKRTYTYPVYIQIPTPESDSSLNFLFQNLYLYLYLFLSISDLDTVTVTVRYGTLKADLEVSGAIYEVYF